MANYVCTYGDLDKLLPENLKQEFKGLFYNPDGTQRKDAWRMFYGKMTPEKFLSRFDIDIENPTVRAAVAFDLVKLDDGSVSNDTTYTYPEHINYSSLEYERLLLHRNFRVNLVNLDPEWSNIKYRNKEERKRLRTVERVYQGARLSKSLLGYFKEVFDKAFNEDGTPNKQFDIGSVYIPFTNANDFTTEVSLIPNTHPDFRAVTSRAYYDMRYRKYRHLLAKYGITAISSFALVDPEKDKNHTGEYLVKVQRKIGESKYLYVVATIDSEGQIKDKPTFWASNDNTILCVYRDDFNSDRTVPVYDYDNLTENDYWHPEQEDEDGNTGIRDIPMVKSTTSSHFSVFRQRIPDYELKYVRNYIQFKTRLEGMELCLKQLKRDIWRKEVQSSDCFNKETIYIWKMFQELTKNKRKMELVNKYYDLVAEYDQLVMRRVKLVQTIDGKQAILNELLEKYNALDSSRLNEKMALGQKIKSVRLELDKTFVQALDQINDRLLAIKGEVGEINDQIENSEQEKPEFDWGDDDKEALEARKQEVLQKVWNRIGSSPASTTTTEPQQVEEVETGEDETNPDDREILVKKERDLPALASIASEELKKYVALTERWRGYMFNLGYELSQMKIMLTKCEDATIKVRRLVHNFKERMEETEEQVWDENHKLRDDFDFKGVALAGINDIILLHDWYACNAPEKTPEEMGMTEDEFTEFRKKCNKISFNLRKNQYAQMLAIRRTRLEDIVNNLKSRKDEDSGVLKWKDKYGWEAKKEQDLLLDMQTGKKEGQKKTLRRSVQMFARVEPLLERQEKLSIEYKKDLAKLENRTVSYLKDIGIIKNKEDLENLVVESKVANSGSNFNEEVKRLEKLKGRLDEAKGKLLSQRDSLKSILDSITKVDLEVAKLKEENSKIFNVCLTMKNRQARTGMLMRKLDNEKKIEELSLLSRKTRKDHLEDLSKLEKMRAEVDERQSEFDKAVSGFRKDVNVSEQDIANLMVGIYNRFQDEILNGEK